MRHAPALPPLRLWTVHMRPQGYLITHPQPPLLSESGAKPQPHLHSGASDQVWGLIGTPS